MGSNHIPATSAQWFVRNLVYLDLSPQGVLEGTGLDADWLTREDATIREHDYVRIVKNALEKSGDPALGTKVGQWHSLAEYGVWGYAIMSCATAGEAMRVALKYWQLNGGLVNVSSQLKGDDLLWTISPAFEFNDEGVLIYAVEEVLSTTYASCQALFQENFDIRTLHLSYARPPHGDLYTELTGADVYFNAPENQLIVSSEILGMPTVTGQTAMKNMCEKQCQELLLKLKNADSLTESIRKIIVDSMGRFPKAEEVAQQLDISPRTLFRRLRDRDTSYQKILDEVRGELARDYLKNTNLSIDQVSELIGFAETTTFRQAFKKWTGVSPSAYKKEIPGSL